MGKLVIEQIDSKVKVNKIAKAVYTSLNQKENLMAELIFIDAEKMRSLNRDTRGADKVTDVLSYPTMDGIKGEILDKKNHPFETEGKVLMLGSIVLCKERIEEQAKELEHSYEDETTYLIVHGLMHLFGYDHMEENDKKEMREKEKSALLLLGKKDE